MKKTTLFLIAAAMLCSTIVAQKSSFYYPKNIIRAYEKGTRSYDGKPGANYWTNHADYKIQAELFPEKREVKGTVNIKYYNESPDSLRSLVIRLYQDFLKKGTPRSSRVSLNDETEGTQIDTMMINGVGLNLKSRELRIMRRGSNMTINNLPKKIAPKGSADIMIKWSVIIPKETRIRMGAYNDSTFYVAYWYPQIAVYDDIDGWDQNQYDGGALEFYNDKNNFDVEITVPKNYLVWGSGLYQNLEEVLKPELVARYKEAWSADGIIKIVTQEDLKNGTTLGSGKNVWKFKGENIPDFSWATSSGYLWDATTAEVDDTGRRVLTDAAYPPKSKTYEEVALFAKLSVQQLSVDQPGFPFPYPKITTFNGETEGGGGMESPMMTNNGISGRGGQAGVTLHEIAHTYFPFFMGINERKYAWMDEGWATFFTSANQANVVDGGTGDAFEGNIRGVSTMMGNETDFPLITLSSNTPTSQNYGFNSYAKASTAYYFLKDVLGDDLFKKALLEYINRWNGKHPLPYDFFNTFNDVAKEDLSWFWNPWFIEQGYPDLGVKSVKPIKGGTEIVVEKIGIVPIPIELEITYSDNTKEKVNHSTSTWKTGNAEFKIELKNSKEVKRVELLDDGSPDGKLKNNVWEKK
ncbi:MAG: Aminopeptidase N [Stygiobacter sp.]|nr:MAG: Aminopeptidase N [Stygiobacter sp.]KAF0217163.1 MAG: Aminopeptidase [Ignavibacteria bacterium]